MVGLTFTLVDKTKKQSSLEILPIKAAWTTKLKWVVSIEEVCQVPTHLVPVVERMKALTMVIKLSAIQIKGDLLEALKTFRLIYIPWENPNQIIPHHRDRWGLSRIIFLGRRSTLTKPLNTFKLMTSITTIIQDSKWSKTIYQWRLQLVNKYPLGQIIKKMAWRSQQISQVKKERRARRISLRTTRKVPRCANK